MSIDVAISSRATDAPPPAGAGRGADAGLDGRPAGIERTPEPRPEWSGADVRTPRPVGAWGRATFQPAGALLGRLRYAQKIVLVAVVLLLPLGFVTYGYVDIQRGQVAFSALERDGVAYLRPLFDLTVRTVQARHAAVTGADPARAGVADAVGPVDVVDARYGEAFETAELWEAAKTALREATGVLDPAAALAAYTKATAALLAVTVRVSDKSNLTLDPDLDTYYVMDALVFRLPLLLDVASQAVDQAVVHAGGAAERVDAARIDLAIAGGALATTRDALAAGMDTAFARTASEPLRQLRPAVDAVLGAVTVTLDQVTEAVRSGDLRRVRAATAEQTTAAIAELAAALSPIEDDLIAVRIDGFDARAHRVVAAALVAVLLVAYLLVGFYRSATVPLRRMVAALGALADGDLTARVVADTRDEVGQMAGAYNEAIDRIRPAIAALRDSAADVAGSSAELSQVSRHLRGAAEETSDQADHVSRTAARVAGSTHDLAGGTAEMTAAVQEIAVGVHQAVGVAAQAVAATAAGNQAIDRLGRSSVEIADVVKLINTIAAQIRLLALNATIEAARAGQAGRGFAVVAGEVKNLAQETARATETITTRIQAIRDDSQATVAALGHIGHIVTRIDDIQTAIASAIEEQTATTREMSRSVAEVAGASTDIATGLTAVTRSAEQTTTSAVVTERAAGQLAATATDLRAVIARFRT